MVPYGMPARMGNSPQSRETPEDANDLGMCVCLRDFERFASNDKERSLAIRVLKV